MRDSRRILVSLSLLFTFGQTAVAQLPTPGSGPNKSLRQVSPGVESLPDQFALVLSATHLNRLVATRKVEEGPVRDYILGAEVFGSQKTEAHLSLELIPASNAARLRLVLNGTTQNQTTNFMPRAAIHSRGNYGFQISKQIEFDGKTISTWSPAAFLVVDQRNVGVTTQWTPLPLLGPLTDRTALRIANRRLPQAEQVAAFKITEQLAPQFNEGIDHQISEMNLGWQGTIAAGLRQFRFETLRFSAHTTSDHLTLAASSATPVQTIRTLDVSSEGVNVSSLIINEAMLNSLLERIPVAGLRLTDTQLEKFAQGNFAALSATGIPKFFSLILADDRPLAVRVLDEALEIDVTVTIQPVLGAALPPHRISMRVTSQLQGEFLELTGTVQKIQPIDNDSISLLAGVSLELLSAQFAEQFGLQRIPRIIPLTGLWLNDNVDSLQIRQVRTQGPGLRIDFELVPASKTNAATRAARQLSFRVASTRIPLRCRSFRVHQPLF